MSCEYYVHTGCVTLLAFCLCLLELHAHGVCNILLTAHLCSGNTIRGMCSTALQNVYHVYPVCRYRQTALGVLRLEWLCFSEQLPTYDKVCAADCVLPTCRQSAIFFIELIGSSFIVSLSTRLIYRTDHCLLYLLQPNIKDQLSPVL